MLKSNANKIVPFLIFVLIACSPPPKTIRTPPADSATFSSRQTSTNILPESAKQENQAPKSFDETDVLRGHVLVRAMEKNQSSLILFKNPTGLSAVSMVFCQHSLKAARAILNQPQGGGLVILKGSTVLFKNDKSKKFNDGTNLRGDYVQMNCI